MKKRLLAALVALTLVLSLLPTWALAVTPRTTALDFSDNPASEDRLSAEGWSWAQSAKTLTLSGLSMTLDSTDSANLITGILLPEGATLSLEGSNAISVTSTGQTMGIKGAGLTVNGAGNLTLTVTGPAAYGMDIGSSTTPAILDGSGTLTVNCLGSRENRAIQCSGCVLNIKSGTVNLTAGKDTPVTRNYGLYCGTLNITGDSKLTAVGRGVSTENTCASMGIYASSTITLSLGDEGFVAAKSEGGYASYAIDCARSAGLQLGGMTATQGPAYTEKAYLHRTGTQFVTTADGDIPCTDVKILAPAASQAEAQALITALGGDSFAENTNSLVKLKSDVTLSQGIFINGVVELDLAGYTITNQSPAPESVSDTNLAALHTISVLSGGNLTVSSSTGIGAISGARQSSLTITGRRSSVIYVAAGGSLTVAGGTLRGSNGGVVLRSDLDGDKQCRQPLPGGNGITCDGSLTITGGTIQGGNGAAFAADYDLEVGGYTGFINTDGENGGCGVWVGAHGQLTLGGTPTIRGGNGGDGGDPGDDVRRVAPSNGGSGGTALFSSVSASLTVSGGSFTGGSGGYAKAAQGGRGGAGVYTSGDLYVTGGTVTGGNGGQSDKTGTDGAWAQGGWAHYNGFSMPPETSFSKNGLPGGMYCGNGGAAVQNASSPAHMTGGLVTGGNGGGTPAYRYVELNIGSNLTAAANTGGAKAAISGRDYVTILTAAAGYRLPDSITVTCGGTLLTKYTNEATNGYSYHIDNGELRVDGRMITGDLRITADAPAAYAASVTGSPTLTARTENTASFTLNTTQVPDGTSFVVNNLPIDVTQTTTKTTGNATTVILTAADMIYRESVPLTVTVQIGSPFLVATGELNLSAAKRQTPGYTAPDLEPVKMVQGQEQRYELRLNRQIDYVDITYSLGALSGDNIFSTPPKLETYNSGLTSLKATSAKATVGQRAVQKLILHSRDFADVTVDVTFTVTEKQEVAISGLGVMTLDYDGAPYDGFYGAAVFKQGTQTVTPDSATLTLLYTGTDNGDAAYSASTPPTNAGSYTLTATLVNDPVYTGQWSGSFTIGKAVAGVYPDALTRPFGELNPPLTFAVGSMDLKGSDTVDVLGVTLSTTATQFSEVGEYPIAGKGVSNNYDVRVQQGSLMIHKAPGLTVTPPAYIPVSAAASSFDLSALMLNRSNAGTLSYTLGSLTNADGLLSTAPTLDSDGHTLRFSGAVSAGGERRAALMVTVTSKNYEDATVTLTFLQTAKQLVTIGGLTIADSTYSGTAHAGCSGTATFTGGTPTNTALTVSYAGTANDGTAYQAATPPTKAGSYCVTASLADDESCYGQWSQAFSIAKKPVTVTAESKAKTFGAENPALTFTVPEGALVGDDTPTALGVELTTTAAKSSFVIAEGYPITGSVLNTGNYQITVTPGTLTVNKAAAPTVADVTKNLVCSAAYSDVAADITGLPSDCGTVSFAAGAATGTTAILSGDVTATASGIKFSTAIGTAADSVTIPVAVTMQNYESVTINVIVNLISKTQIAVSGVTASGKTYDGAVLTYQNTALVCTPAYTGTLEYVWNTQDGTAPKDAGTYTLTVKIPDSDPSFMGQQVLSGLTIAPKAVTVQPKNLTITSGSALPAAFELVYTGLVAGDTLTPAGAPIFELQKEDGTALMDSKTNGAYKIAWTNKDAVFITKANYTITKSDGTLTIYTPTSGGGSVAPRPTEPAITTENGSTTAVVEATVMSSGTTTTATVTQAAVQSAIRAAVAAAENGSTKVQIKVETPQTAQKAELSLPGAALAILADSDVETLIISTGLGEITLSREAAASIATQSGSKNVKITIAKVDAKKTLSERQQAAVGDATVYDLSITGNGKHITQFDGGLVSVSLPETLKAGEDSTGVAVWYLDGNENVQRLHARYDVEAKTVTFTTNHFSLYAVGYDEIAATPNLFTDVAETAFYRDAAVWASVNGIAEGTSAMTFSPNAACTRAQAVTFLWRAMGSPEPISKACPFTDVDSGAYYYKAVLWAVEKDITKGTGDATFSPNDTVTRAQAVTFQWRAADSPVVTTANPFTDVGAELYYTGAVLWAVSKHITDGATATTFSPARDCTRAQIATFLWRQFGK